MQRHRACAGAALAAAAMAALAASGGCAYAPETPETPRAAATSRVFGKSAEGRPIVGKVLGDGPEAILLFGVIHGNEPLGAPLLEALEERVLRRPALLDGVRAVIVPVLNPDGLERGTRGNARGVDLNRNFPAANWVPGRRHGKHPASEAETRVLLEIIRSFRPSRILAVHSPLDCVNYDGPAASLARAMAIAAGYPLRSSIGYSTPGSLGSYAGKELGIPTITLELPPRAARAAIWRDAGPAVEVFLRGRGGPEVDLSARFHEFE